MRTVGPWPQFALLLGSRDMLVEQKGCVVPCHGPILCHPVSPESWAKGTLGFPLTHVPFVTFFATLYGGAFLLLLFFCSVSVLERETWRLFKSDNSLFKRNLCPAEY